MDGVAKKNWTNQAVRVAIACLLVVLLHVPFESTFQQLLCERWVDLTLLGNVAHLQYISWRCRCKLGRQEIDETQVRKEGHRDDVMTRVVSVPIAHCHVCVRRTPIAPKRMLKVQMRCQSSEMSAPKCKSSSSGTAST